MPERKRHGLGLVRQLLEKVSGSIEIRSDGGVNHKVPDTQHKYPTNPICQKHLGAITGYTNGVGFFTHTVADSNRSLMALIATAPSFPGPGFFLPTTNFKVFNWCLQQGLRLAAQATYMTIGLFNEPDGAWLPGVLY